MDALPDTLDVICSSRTTSAQRSTALSRLEYIIASIYVPKDAQRTPQFQEFSKLQAGFESNIPSRLLIWIASATGYLEVLLSRGSNLDQDKQDESKTIASQLIQALGIIQGVALNHRATKTFLGRRYSLEILVDLLLVSRHVSSPPSLRDQQSSTGLSSSASSNDGTKDQEQGSSKRPQSQSPPQLASAVLDTLLCILVDSSVALRAFEESKGVQVAVKILKRAGTPREVRMKCLEFLYFYLLDEHSFVVPSSTQRRTGSESSLPLSLPPSVTTQTPATSPLKATFGESITGNRDGVNQSLAGGSGSLLPAFSPSPKSRAAQSDASSSPFEASLRASSSQRFRERLENSTSLSSSGSSASSFSNSNSSPGKLGSAFMPTFSTSNLTSAPRNIFPLPEPLPVPSSLRTPPRSNSAPHHTKTGTGPSSKQLVMVQKELDFGAMTPKKAQVAGLGKGAAPSIPNRTSSVLENTSRAVFPPSSNTTSTSASDTISNPPSTGNSMVTSTNQRPSLGTRTSSSGLVNGARSPRRYRDAETGRIMVSPRSEKEKENKAQLRHGLGVSGLNGIRGTIVKSTEEKKELLGSMLGNVDALVEGVKKAGIWGLG